MEKTERASVFAAWLAQEFAGVLQQGTGVLDIAGGRGELAQELQQRTGANVTVVDPQENSFTTAEGVVLERPTANTCAVPIVRAWFDEDFAVKYPNLCASSSLLCGMHPDQATEAIVDIALEHKIPFAVVPCCVFQTVFPLRRLVWPNGHSMGVKKYACFIKYLLQKDSRIKTAQLGFEGRNTVLYMAHFEPAAAADDGPFHCQPCQDPRSLRGW